jgi:hypothetical protein
MVGGRGGGEHPLFFAERREGLRQCHGLGALGFGRRPPFQILYSDDIFMFLGRVLITEKKAGFRRFILGTGRC